MVFIYFVIALFLLAACLYFYNNSLSTTLQRSQTLKSAILCIYYLPVFLLSFSVLYAGVINFYFLVEKLFLQNIYFFADKNNIAFVIYFMLNACFVALIFWMAKKSFPSTYSLVSLLYIAMYFISSTLVYQFFKAHFSLLFLYQFNFVGNCFTDIFLVLSVGTILLFLVWCIPIFLKRKQSFFTYTRLGIKVIIGYISIAMLVAIVGLVFKLLAYLFDLFFAAFRN